MSIVVKATLTPGVYESRKKPLHYFVENVVAMITSITLFTQILGMFHLLRKVFAM